MRRRRVLSTRGRQSGYYEPADGRGFDELRADIRRTGTPCMRDPRVGALVVPVRLADSVDAALWTAGWSVEVVLGLGAA